MSQAVLQDQVIMIVGGGRAPALSMARALAKAGAIIAVNDLSPVLLDPLEAQVRADGGQIQAYIADATRGMPLRAMIDEVLSDWGRIDVLINNPRIQPKASLLALDEWDWQRTVEMNLNGPFLVSQLVAKMMREQGQGVILNIVDTNQPVLEAPDNAAYAASQQGLLSFSQAAGREFMAYNIRVYTLCPDAAIFYPDAIITTANPGQTLDDLAVYLCSPAASHQPGQVFRVSSTEVMPPIK